MTIRDYMMTGAVCVLATAMQVFAQAEDAQEADPVVVAPDGKAEQGGITEQGGKKDDKGFELLVRVTTVRGEAMVLNPDVGTATQVVKNKAYPLGSTFRTGRGGSVSVSFSGSLTENIVEMLENTEAVMLAPADNPKARAVRLVSGRIKTNMKDNLLEGQFSVETPNAKCKNMAGKGEFSLTMEGENEIFQAATIRGSAYVEGPQYTIEKLEAANTVNVLTTPNRALSRLTSEKGDFKITLDNGTEDQVIADMSPKAIVKIMRSVAPVGGRLIVSTLVMGPTGKARDHFTYAVGRGDIVPKASDAVSKDVEKDLNLKKLLGIEEKETKPKQADEAKQDAQPPAQAEQEKDVVIL